MMTRLECRMRMHDAERLAKLALTGVAIERHLVGPIERAYLSHTCEPGVAQRIHVALDAIG